MGRFINELIDLPNLDLFEARQLVEDAEATALRHVPELDNAEPSADLLAVFRRIVMRWKIEGPAAVVTQTTGPFGIGLSSRRVGWKLAEDELADLREIVGAAASTSGGARGSFPDPVIGRIFDGPSS